MGRAVRTTAWWCRIGQKHFWITFALSLISGDQVAKVSLPVVPITLLLVRFLQ